MDSTGCTPSEAIGPDDSLDPDRRIEALVLELTGIDELQLEQEDTDVTYGDPNYGGVWHDGEQLVVAVIDCSDANVDRIAEIAGGSDAVQIIEVPYAFEEVNRFSRELVAELDGLGLEGSAGIDPSPQGRRISVMIESPADTLPADFAPSVPKDIYSVVGGMLVAEEAFRSD